MLDISSRMLMKAMAAHTVSSQTLIKAHEEASRLFAEAQASRAARARQT